MYIDPKGLGCLVAKWLKRWTTDPGVGVYSALLKKVSRCRLKVFPPEVYTASFGGDVKPSVPGTWFK